MREAVGCKQIEIRLNSFVDGNLTLRDHTLVESHLDQCDRCTKQHLRISKLLNSLSTMERVDAPPDFLDGFVSHVLEWKLAGQKRRNSRRRIGKACGLLAAALAIAFVSGFIAKSSGDERSRPLAESIQKETDVFLPSSMNPEALTANETADKGPRANKGNSGARSPLSKDRGDSYETDPVEPATAVESSER